MENNGPSCEICGEAIVVNGLRYAAFTHSRTENFCEKCVAAGETAIKIKVCDKCGCEVVEKTTYKVVKKEAPQPLPSVKIVKGSGVPDVWYGYGSGTHTEENIAYPHGHPQAGEPIPFSDRRSKKAAMDLAGVREAGDKGVRCDDGRTGKKKRTYFT